MFIPYAWLSEQPQHIMLCGGVPVYFHLSALGGRDCLVSLAGSHAFECGQSVYIPVGTTFELEYRGVVDEIRLGRRIVICDA